MKLPASPQIQGDRRYVMAERLSGGRLAFNIAVDIALHGPLDPDQVARAIHAVVRVQPALTGNWTDGGLWCDRDPDELSVSIDQIDVSSRSNPSDAVAALRADLIARQFNLNAGALARFALIRHGAGSHRLIAVFHRSIFDGDSAALFADALFRALRGESLNSPLSEPRPGAEQIEQRTRWWTRAVLPLPPRTSIGSFRAGQSVTAARGSRVERIVRSETATHLRAIAADEKTVVSNLLLVAWAEVVRVHAGEDTIVIGVNKTLREKSEDVIDGLDTELPLRYESNPNASFLERVREIERWDRYAIGNRLSVDRIVGALGVNRDPDQPPLTGVLFSDRPVTRIGHVAGDITGEVLNEAMPPHDYEVRLGVAEESEAVSLTVDFDPEMYDELTIVRLLRRLEHWIAQAVSAPNDPVRDFSMVPVDEAERLVVGLNQTETPWPAGETLHGLFEKQVDTDPERPALRYLGRTTSFGELEQDANRIAAWLIRRGVAPGERVAFALSRSPRLVATMLGILKAGAAYVAVDASHPHSRITQILDDCDARILLTERGVGERIPEACVEAIWLDEIEPTLRRSTPDRPAFAVKSSAPACLIYTSGSTGRPKGVVSPHSGYVNVCHWAFSRFEKRPHELGCIKTTPGFADSVWEIFGALGAGVESVIVPDSVCVDPERLLDLLSRERVTRIILVPSLLRALLDTGRNLAQEIPQLTLWFPGGEATPADLCRQLIQSLPRARVINNYGCSEACAVTTWYEVKEAEDRSGVPIGAPVINTRVYVLDDEGRPVPEGAPGELCIAGEGVALGYHNNPGLSANRFCDIEPVPGRQERVYRTGDRVRWLARGALEYLGRADKQVQIRGFRIELTEIETILRSHDAVREAVVATGALGSDPSALVAWVVPAGATAPTQAVLRDWCRQHVPGYMIPRTIGVVQSLPLNQNGKVDRSALELLDREETHVSALDDETLQRLTEVFADVLGISGVHPDDDFFELGGHSLLAMALADEIESVFELPLEMGAVYESPTPRELAAHLRSVAGPVSLVRLNKGQRDTPGMPVYCVFGLFLYRALAEQMRDSHAVFGGYVEYEVEIFRAIVDNAERIELPLVEELADRYVDLIHSASDGGPYALAGASFGGVVALEVARRLRELGDDVAMVALFDSPYPSSRFHTLRELGRDVATSMLLRGGSLGRSFRNRFSSGAQASFSHDREELRQIVLEQAMRRFTPQPYDGSVVLYQALDDDGFNIQRDRAAREWARLCTEDFRVVQLEGGHLDILSEPRVGVLADDFSKAIARTRKSERDVGASAAVRPARDTGAAPTTNKAATHGVK